MTQAAPQTIHISDYLPPDYLVDSVHLTFRLDPHKTRVLSRIAFRPNPAKSDRQFRLDGQDLTLISARIDGKPVACNMSQSGLTCDAPDAPFLWEAEVEIDPANNTSLDGLYMSNGMYCTQCEAEGFRKITYYPDRPDVMAVFSVRIESDLPVLLSNGDPVATGPGFAEWHDPWPKPSYLFAMVAGDLVNDADTFVTKSGREVDLNIWVRKGDLDKCAFGMSALKRSMKWDEDTYGREYDLDIFNIVAVDDFNMGAMENKGLNIFNSSCVLASSDTSTDADFERIDAIIAHEYFHNWTGNRITCRDWFQLCLKEGLTVFRDQQYTGDQIGAAVKRIKDVLDLREFQFREDAGPLSHPVRPESFVEINNFYTATVYEKGAEVIGMLRRLVGAKDYRRALDLYFERHDGQAATIEDWLQVFSDVTGRDLTQFKRWYSQSGTPLLTVTEGWSDDTLTLTFSQHTPSSVGKAEKLPFVIPIAVGLLSPNGDEVVPTTLLEMTKATQSFSFSGLGARPIPSILREFSAPVILKQDQSDATRAFLLAHDTDPFNKWEAGRGYAKTLLLKMIRDGADPETDYCDALSHSIADETLDPAFRALLLPLPTEEDLALALFEGGQPADPDLIHTRRNALRQTIAEHCADTLGDLMLIHQADGPFDPDPKAAGKRALTNAALSYLTLIDSGITASAQFEQADNMTRQLAALSALVSAGMGQDELAQFETRWTHDRLVMDKWFGLQVRLAPPQEAVRIAAALTQRPDFDAKNPNRLRSVLGGLAANQAGFHEKEGGGYRFIADWLIRTDPVNPQTASRLSTAFQTWRRFDPARQGLIQTELTRVRSSADLSTDLAEMIDRMLGT